jgi:two-component system sensor histidine kinase PfeS
MRRRHSLLWKLALLQTGFCLVLVWLVWFWGLHVERRSYFLDDAEQQRLAVHAAQVERRWLDEGATGVERWRQAFMSGQQTWAAVIGPQLQSLGTTALSAEESGHLTFMRRMSASPSPPIPSRGAWCCSCLNGCCRWG